MHRLPNNAQNTQRKLGVAFSYLERKYCSYILIPSFSFSFSFLLAVILILILILIVNSFILILDWEGGNWNQAIFLRRPTMQYCNNLISPTPDERKQRDYGQNL